MSHKSAQIARLIAGCQGQGMDAHYLGYFECFNQQLFYEAHDVLEELWLGVRRTSAGDFYKGLIQFAGAFVHMQKGRPQPAARLLDLSSRYLSRYGDQYERLDVKGVLTLATLWKGRLEGLAPGQLILQVHPPPRLKLME